MSRWHWHPRVRSGDQLTRGERAADRMRNGMGSWWFVGGACLFLAVWMLGNRRSGFDPFPFILLNLVLSCVAALQGSILLIAAKRSDQVSSELAQHDYEADVASHQILTDMAVQMSQAVDLLSSLHTRLDAAGRRTPTPQEDGP